MIKDFTITLEWTEGGEPKKRVARLNLPNEEKDIILIHIRAGLKAIYKSLLKHFYSGGELIGMLSTQMIDKTRTEQIKAIEVCNSIVSKIEQKRS